MRIKAGNQLSGDAQVLDFGVSASLAEVDGHVQVANGGSLSAVGDAVILSDSGAAGTGDIVFKTHGGTERLRIADTTGLATFAGDVQLPTTKLLHDSTITSYLGVKNTVYSADQGTRFYIIPQGAVTTGVGGALKIFGDDYSADQANYRDFGIYFSADQNGVTGQQGKGVVWLNSKVLGTYAGKNPDIGFSFQDGATIAGVWSYISSSQVALVIGAATPSTASSSAGILLDLQGDMGIGGTGAGKGIRWFQSAGNLTNLLQFNNTDVTLKLSSAQKLKVTSNGSLIHGSAAGQMGTTTTDGFFYLWSMAGTPTGTPTTATGSVPLAVDTTGSKLWAYIGGVWKSVTFA